jgi:hypothetical protein
MSEKKHFDLNFEEISPERTVSDGNWANGLQNFRFSVAASGGGAWIPSMSYFLVEYAFGDMQGASNIYTPTQALRQQSKITLQNDFMGSMYSASSFKMAGSDISVINSNHAHASVLKKRLGYTTEFIENLSGDLNGFDPDFSRRLAKFSIDGTYHRDGLIDCSPYLSYPVIPGLNGSRLVNWVADPIVYTTFYDKSSNVRDTTFDPDDNNPSEWMFTDQACTEPVRHKIGNQVRGFQWRLADHTLKRDDGHTGEINATHILTGDKFYFDLSVVNPVSDQKFITANNKFKVLEYTVVNITESNNGKNGAVLSLSVPNDTLFVGDFSALMGGDNKTKPKGAITQWFSSRGTSTHTQPDPRANVVNNAVIYQPPLAVFECQDPVFYGDMMFQLTPNSNWKKAAIESAVAGNYYGSSYDVQHGTDYAFGIKSLRFYIARVKIPSLPPKQIAFSMPDMIIANKNIPSGASNIDFIVPPSTQKIVIWIQDTSAGSDSRLPLSRFKTRQDIPSGNDFKNMDRYGPWAHTYDERLNTIQVTFAGITKPMSNFSSGDGVSNDEATKNSMLQRWIMTNQNNHNRVEPEKFHDWLSMGPYYLYDFSRDSMNQGTYLQVKTNFQGKLPVKAESRGDTSESSVNLFVCAIYDRNISLTYSEYGAVVSAQTAMA